MQYDAQEMGSLKMFHAKIMSEAINNTAPIFIIITDCVNAIKTIRPITTAYIIIPL